MSKKAPSNLLEQNSALGTYLDDMLHQATEAVSVGSVTTIDESLLPEALLLEVEDFEAVAISIEVNISDQESQVQITQIEDDAYPKQELESSDEQLQELSAELFPLQFLMFKVGDNLLSIPLIKMSSVIDWTDTLTLTCLPNEPDWLHGILQHREHNVRIVDSSKVLQIRNQNKETPSHILILEGESWGLTCDAIENVISLEYDDIQWNQHVGNSMTLGTIKDSLASLLSPGGIVQSLQSGI